MEHKAEKSKETTPTSSESKGVLGSVWSAAGALAETVQNAVQGTYDKIQQNAEPAVAVGGYVANKVAESANIVLDKTKQTAESAGIIKKETDPSDAFFSSPTEDMIAATTIKTEEPTFTQAAADAINSAKVKTSELFDTAKKSLSESVANASSGAEKLLDEVNKIASDNIKAASDTILDKEAAANTEVVEKPKFDESTFKLELTMDVVAHLQRIADRTGDVILHDTARKAHSACAKGLSDSPGVHLVRVTPDQATELVNLAILTQDHELANFARYCQSVAATTQVGIEPSPGKIMEELNKGKQELSQQGRMHTGPGYGAAFASVTRSTSSSNLLSSQSSSNIPATTSTSAPAEQQPQQQAASGSPQLTMDMVAHLQRIADRTGDKVLHDTARKAHSACAKGLSDAPGVHLVSVTPDQASELVNLAIRTQDHELANFARYCQSVAATSQLGIEPTPGKILEEIAKGRQELQQQGRTHTGPGYGAAFASITRSNSQQNLKTSRSSSPTNIPLASSASQESISVADTSAAASAAPSDRSSLKLTMDVVAHLQRIADRTGDALLHETARKAHSACAKNISEAPGVHLTLVTPEQATELVNLAIRTQDHELADFARYCQSVAATTQIGVEPSPGKIKEEIEKGRQELQQQGRAHTGPGYGAAFASKQAQPTTTPATSTPSVSEQKVEPAVESLASPSVGQPAQ